MGIVVKFFQRAANFPFFPCSFRCRPYRPERETSRSEPLSSAISRNSPMLLDEFPAAIKNRARHGLHFGSRRRAFVCKSDVAIATPLAQLWPGKLGMFAGYIRYTMGTFHEISPTCPILHPPDFGGSTSGSAFFFHAFYFCPDFLLEALARVWSASLPLACDRFNIFLLCFANHFV